MTSLVSVKELLELLPTPILIVDSDMQVVTANPAFYQTFRAEFQDFENRPVEDFINSDRSLLYAARDGDDAVQFESRMTFPTGQSRILLLHAQALRSEDGETPLLMLTFEDITERKHSEDIRDRLAALVESSSDAIISKTLDGIIVTWNSTAEKLFGYTEAEAVGQSIYLLFPPELYDEEVELLRRVRSNENVSDYETVRLHKNGTRLNVAITLSPIFNAEGQLIGISKIAREISRERRETAYLRRLLQAGPDAMVIVNEQGNIILVNAQTENIFGYTSAEMIGQPVEMLIPERYQQSHLGDRSSYIAAPRLRPMGANLELYGLRKDRSEFPLEISLSPIEMEGGIVVSAAIRDITERKRNLQLRTALEHERRLNMLKARFMAMISHEFRTPLAGIQAVTDLLIHHGERLSESTKKLRLGLIENYVDGLVAMLDDILTLSKAQSVGLEMSLSELELVPSCQRIINTLPAKGNAIRFLMNTETTTMLADAKLLSYALTNLLSNALKYSPDGGTVTLEVTSDTDSVIFRVSDQGIGIPENEQENLFQLFYRGSNVKDIPGTGLGLAIVKEVAEAHHGSITFTSQDGIGTTFRLLIPKQQQNRAGEYLSS